MNIEKIYAFYEKSTFDDLEKNKGDKTEVLKKPSNLNEESKENRQILKGMKSAITLNQEIIRDRETFKNQLKLIKKYMRWYFSLRENSFLKNNVKKTDFVFKRVTLSSDGKKLARLDYDRNLSIYDITNISQPILLFIIYDIFIGHKNIRFSYDSDKIAFYDNGNQEINVWDLKLKKCRFKYKGIPQYLTFCKTGNYLGAIFEDSIKFYEKDSIISETKEINNGSALDFPYNNSEIVCIVVDQNIIIWNFKTKKTLIKFDGDPESKINYAQFCSSDSKIIAGNSKKQILMWDFTLEMEKVKSKDPKKYADAKTLTILMGHEDDVLSVIMSKDEKYIFSYENPKLFKVYIWKKNEKEQDYSLHKNFVIESQVSSETFSENNVFFVSYDFLISQYNVIEGKMSLSHNISFGKRNNPIAYNSYSLYNHLVAKLSNKNIAIHDVLSGKGLKNIPIAKIFPLALAFSKNSNEIAFSTKDHLVIYEISKDPIKKCSAQTYYEILIIRYIDEKKLITGGKDGQLHIWTFKDQTLTSSNLGNIHEKNQINMISIHFNQKIFCSADSKGKVVLWNFNKNPPSMEASMDLKENENEEIHCSNAKFYPKQQKCLIGNSKGKFFVWNLEKPSEIQIEQFMVEYLPTEEKNMQNLSDFDICPEEKILALIDFDGRIVVWSLVKNQILRTYQFTQIEKKDEAFIEVFFKPNCSNTLILRAKQCYKEIKIDPEITEVPGIKSMKAMTSTGKIVSLFKDEGIIKVFDNETGLTLKFLAEETLIACHFSQL